MKQEKILDAIILALPDPGAIRDIDLTSNPTAVAFDWHQSRYLVDSDLQVYETEGSIQVDGNSAVLMEARELITEE